LEGDLGRREEKEIEDKNLPLKKIKKKKATGIDGIVGEA